MSAVAKLEVEVVANLDDLADAVRREHGLAMGSFRDAVGHAIRAGEALLKARSTARHGHWQEWLNSTGVTRQAAHEYMRVAKYQEVARDHATMKGAMRALRGLPAATTPLNSTEEEVRDLTAAGMTPSEIADALGVGIQTVRKWMDPAVRSRLDATKKASQRRIHEQRSALKRQEREAAMKTAGGDAWDAYLLVRKLAPMLDRLKMNAEYAKLMQIEEALAIRAKAA